MQERLWSRTLSNICVRLIVMLKYKFELLYVKLNRNEAKIMSQRKVLNEVAEKDFDKEERFATVTFDGKQCQVKIPKEIARLTGMEKGDKIKFTYIIPPEPKPLEEGELKVEVVRKNGKR